MTSSPLIKASIRSKLCSEIKPIEVKNNILNAAVSFVIYQQDCSSMNWQNCELLFMQRAAHPKDPWSGQIAFPGGGVEAIDASSVDTAIRETHEEMGFVLSKDRWLGSMNEVYGPVISDIKKVNLIPHVFLLNHRPEINFNEEAQAAFWVSFDRLSKKQFVSSFNNPAESSIEMFGIDVGNDIDVPLWGLSLEVLYQFFKIVQWPIEQEMQVYR